MEFEKLLVNDKITANKVSKDVDGETNWPFLKFEISWFDWCALSMDIGYNNTGELKADK